MLAVETREVHAGSAIAVLAVNVAMMLLGGSVALAVQRARTQGRSTA
jgi:hypothetical protein